jgi:hypothetical protein
MRSITCALLGCYLGNVLVAGRDIPRVALLFATNGPMPLERVWRTLLAGVADIHVPELSEHDWAHLEEAERIEGLRSALLSKGQLTANTIIQEAECMDNQMVRVCATMCWFASWLSCSIFVTILFKQTKLSSCSTTQQVALK